MLIAVAASFAVKRQFLSSLADNLAQVMVGIFVNRFFLFLVSVEIAHAVCYVKKNVVYDKFAHLD